MPGRRRTRARGEKLGLRQRGSEAPAILFNGARSWGRCGAVCATKVGGTPAGTGCRKNGELETRGKWELPERSGARAARAGARPLEGEGWQQLLKGLGPGGAPKGQEGGAVLAARATRRSRSLSPALLPLRRRRRTGAGAVGQGGCGRRAFPAGSGTRRCDRGRAAGGGGGRRCSGRGGDRLRGSSEGERSRGRQSPWSELAELEPAGLAGFRSLSPLVRPACHSCTTGYKGPGVPFGVAGPCGG